MLLRQWLCLQWSVSPRHLCWCLFSDQMWSQCQMWKSPTFRTVYMPLWIHRKSSNCMLKMWVQNKFTFWLLLHVTYLLISFDTVGSPIVPGVTVGCDIDGDCPDYTACRNRKCINPCVVDRPCAPSANCRVVKHSPICTCPNGYIGTPQTKCSLRECGKTKFLMPYLLSSSFFVHSISYLACFDFSAPQPECTSDPECPLSLACINQECKDPCFKHVCGINADCKVKRHRPICFCLPGFVGNPNQICEERKLSTPC